jgi:hypothetical protein
MNLCMTELRGLGSNLFANPQGMVSSELVKRTNPEFVAASVPQKRQATTVIQTTKSAPESRQVTPSNPSVVNSNGVTSQLSRTLSDPKRVSEKLKQKQSMHQVYLKKIQSFQFSDSDSFFTGYQSTQDLLVCSSGLSSFRQCANCSCSSFVEVSSM